MNMAGMNMAEYLTTNELSARIKMTPGTIRNLVWKNKFTKGVHYVKPTPRKLLFIWPAIQDWLEGGKSIDFLESKSKSLIKI
jgi:hypothetical protein